MPAATTEEVNPIRGNDQTEYEQDYADSLRPGLNDQYRAWAEWTIGERLVVVKAARHKMAAMTREFAAAISPELGRTAAETLVAELLPLLAAGRFLEQRAEKVLRTRRMGRWGLPFWLAGLKSEVQRVPFGRVMVIGPANYPLFLPGVQTWQGLVAGNAVVWKPGRGGYEVARLFADAMYAAGLPRDVLRITDESIDAAEREIAAGVGKVFFTGSASSGQLLLKRLADTLTPCVLELSGCDAVVVLPTADLDRVVKALVFGMRLNRSATCMAPRRVLLVDATESRRTKFVGMLQDALRMIGRVELHETVRCQMSRLLDEARKAGATILGDVQVKGCEPVLILNASATMSIAQADIFAPVLMVIDVKGDAGVVAAQESCPFGLTASIFGDEAEAKRLATKLTTGTVMVNDLIVPAADPRVPFGGRAHSGFGVTRGTEGLLEMTAIRTVAVGKGRSVRHYEAIGPAHEGLFRGVILASHSATFQERLRGIRELITGVKGCEQNDQV
jgi:acyl-CoA reductase-like NAD-dependent aldehyde dehydrogenase